LCVILSEAKNLFVALEKGDSHHFPPQPAPLKEGGGTAQGIRGKPGLPGNGDSPPFRANPLLLSDPSDRSDASVPSDCDHDYENEYETDYDDEHEHEWRDGYEGWEGKAPQATMELSRVRLGNPSRRQFRNEPCRAL
jgi:hypothetical protein